jgi:hypothetical protein
MRRADETKESGRNVRSGIFHHPFHAPWREPQKIYEALTESRDPSRLRQPRTLQHREDELCLPQ